MFIVSSEAWTVLPYKADIKTKPTDSTRKRVKEAARSKDIQHVARPRETPLSAEGLYELFTAPKYQPCPHPLVLSP